MSSKGNHHQQHSKYLYFMCSSTYMQHFTSTYTQQVPRAAQTARQGQQRAHGRSGQSLVCAAEARTGFQAGSSSSGTRGMGGRSSTGSCSEP